MNNNTQEARVNYTNAKLLKLKCFEQKEMPSYLEVPFEQTNVFKTNPSNVKIGDLIGYYVPNKTVNAPTQSLVIEWIRVNFGIVISLEMIDIQSNKYRCKIVSAKGKFNIYNKDFLICKTPQEAIDAALLYTLQYL